MAAQAGDFSGLERLVSIEGSSDESLRASDSLGRTVWHWLASSTGSGGREKVEALVTALLASFPALSLSSAVTASGETPLHWLCGDVSNRKLTEDDVRIATILIQRGVDPTLRSASGESASDLVRQRLDKGQDKTVCETMLEALSTAPPSPPRAASKGTDAGVEAGVPVSTMLAPMTTIPMPTAAAGPGAGGAKKKGAITVTLKKK